ncbi:MAG: UDP-N-acetylmuramoyl-tripeptide--D-alanyl-D-alanine ligase [Vitreoscilla sp.]|nr:UDP-N-acetylmuramoyl-tripeptide--D-alanyl-D-alanine ligase [Burkholderiales bacterium]MBP6336328.1 UDP-N-acetylmuramoyl-tripeptide--D-alanyl-D-alanine ligase [Vitreoscilla sp.]MBP6674138.1 UDP-N-acetylmuramoyl-tripeptide--D-alanyl-D-alanine ligase [Vitreoscilla sp.]
MTAVLMSLNQAIALVPGATLVGSFGTPFCRVHTDTRSLAPGDMFVALRGENFDGHDFLATAKAAGAVAAIAEHGLAEAGLAGLQVPDSLKALQQLATGWRAQQRLPVIGVTGSNGKTTVTQMIASILRAAHGERALATAGNLNNHIGVPLTVLRLNEHQAAVIELGMNHTGEIAELAAIAQPTVGMVNNAQREHQEFMKSVEAVALENGSVIAALPSHGVAVFPGEDPFTPLWRDMAGGRRVITFGMTSESDVWADAQWQTDLWALQLHTPQGKANVRLRIAGRHNVMNALAAAASALAAGVPLVSVIFGLSAFEPVKGRSQVHALNRKGGAQTLVDDTYNANPDSVRAAIDVLAALPGPRWLLLGDMGEVGEDGPKYHVEVGEYARQMQIDHFWTVGTLAHDAARAYGPGAQHFGTVAELISQLPQGPEFKSVLVKGSRFMKMEQVVAALQKPVGGAA